MCTSEFWPDRILLPWSAFNALGRNRIVRSSYIWATLVPVLAKMLSSISRDFKLPIFSLDIRLVLGVPFTWEILYYSSVCFAIATLVYAVFCPDIVKRYDKYSDFQAEGKGSDQLVSYAFGVSADRTRRVGRHRLSPIQLLRFVRNFCNQRGLDPDDLTQLETSAHIFRADTSHVHSNYQDSAFWYIRDCSDSNSPQLRLVVEVSYAIGFMLFAWVLAQNFWFVFSQHLMSHG